MNTEQRAREIYAFLLGEAPLEGVWFGEQHPTERGNFWWRKRLRALSPPASAAVVPEVEIEAAYWTFDARHKGSGPYKGMPQSERDAFKWAVRAMLAATPNPENTK